MNKNFTDEITNYFLVNVETGKHFEGFDRDDPIKSPLPPKTGEYLNQSGCYFKVVGILQHFDVNYVEVFAIALGDSQAFLKHIQNNH
ncbi:hypothetical protein [Vibrio splendidus]|uniref:hypothetical protein n=1 Tax=Vibrio splendidus TaxID=29497 RepID=UPI00080E08B4|nr:hypothetical protein [Vibrio splendidus]OCH68732.1 hypothetical protein A6D94_04935 [Vibrio splendidus]